MATVALSCCALPGQVAAQTSNPQRGLAIERQDLGAALRELALKSGSDIVFDPQAVVGKTSTPVHGRLSTENALKVMLRGTHLAASRTRSGGFAIALPFVAAGAPADAPQAEADQDVVVTGTRIHGAAPASPVIAMTQKQMRDRGYNDLGEAIRDIPANFAGGQNPTVAISAGGRNNNNITGGSSLNLRGLGADATLTLIDGQRLAYDGIFQGIDIAAIPLAAVDRLEIVPDGASALYGSDAVGGVANAILKNDFSGLDTSFRVGGSTDGGNFQTQYTAVTGGRWSSGGIMVAGSYASTSAITANQRSYTTSVDPSATVIPDYNQVNIVGRVHQDVTSSVTFEMDALYNFRRSHLDIPYATDEPASVYGVHDNTLQQSLVVAPKLRFRLPGDWSATVGGTYGFDNTHQATITANPGSPDDTGPIDDNNQLKSVEGAAEGPLFSLPGGAARLAIGAGYHVTDFYQLEVDDSSVLRTKASRENEYGFGELFLPIVGPAQSITGLRRLSLDLALRYESYPGIAQLGRPKVGVIYEPIDGLVLKGSWGKSFKTPTLLEQYSASRAQAIEADLFTGRTFPPGATTLFLFGGNNNLKPEKATTWTITAEVTPKRIAGLKLSVDYFHIDYQDRVVEPVGAFAGIYTNPIYASYVLLNPTEAQIAAAIARTNTPVENLTGTTFDPATVAAIIDDTNQNATQQKISGVDAALHYDGAIAGSDNVIHLTAQATYLESRQKVTPLLPWQDLAGTIFNPPHWRADGALGWSDRRFLVTAAANYVGGVLDNRYTPIVGLRSMTTFDLVGSVKISSQHGPLRDVTLRLSALNIFNRKPQVIAEATPGVLPFDSTNYSSIGRFLDIEIEKSW